MNSTEITKKLLARNEKIIKLILMKIERLCPGSVDLIGIAGSFESGDFHEKSDLDLTIIINNAKALVLNKCFILENIGFDIYCSKWDRLEKMSEYFNPHVSKLLHLDLVYIRNQEVNARYLSLREKLISNLGNQSSNRNKALNFYKDAVREYGLFVLSEDLAQSLQHLYLLAINVEYTLFMLNNSYVRRGIKRVIEDMSKLEKLPQGFIDIYKMIFVFRDLEELRANVTKLMKLLNAFMDDQEKDYIEKKNEQTSPIDLTGLYEEAYSNWKSKMDESSTRDDFYCAFMAMASCNQFYKEIHKRLGIPLIEIIKNYSSVDSNENLKQFNAGLEKLATIYREHGKKIVTYDNFDQFEKDYYDQA